jgi:hypothetical protein
MHHTQFARVVFNDRAGVPFPDVCAIVRAFDNHLGYSEEMPVARVSMDMKTVYSVEHLNKKMEDDCWWRHSCTVQRTSCVSVHNYLAKDCDL